MANSQKTGVKWTPLGNILLTLDTFVNTLCGDKCQTKCWSKGVGKCSIHYDVIKWKHFPRYWPFVQGIHRWLVNSLHKGQWRGALMFYLICALNKWLSKQSRGWWFETPTRSLWRHCNVLVCGRWVIEPCRILSMSVMSCRTLTFVFIIWHRGPLLLTWINVHPCMDN